LNPLYTVEKQVSEVLRQHDKLDAAESSLGLRIGQALFYPSTLLSNFVRNDVRAGLQLIGAFMFIFVVHQSDNTDTILDILILPIELLKFIFIQFFEIFSIIPFFLLDAISNYLDFIEVIRFTNVNCGFRLCNDLCCGVVRSSPNRFKTLQ